MKNTGKLIKKIKIEGVIVAVSGLHIGGSNTGVGVGGADNLVIRNALSNEPYIPGSSLKGKMRSLLEKLERKFDYDPKGGFLTFGPFLDMDDCETLIPKIFGSTPEAIEKKSKNKNQPPSRLIVRDSPLTIESSIRLNKIRTTDLQFTEFKTEVAIDRVTSKATPRTIERVPAGAKFEMCLLLNVFQVGETESEVDDEKAMLGRVFASLLLVQDDYLGGKGTRGSGEVAIHISKLSYRDKKHYDESAAWSDYSDITIPEELKHDDLIKA